MDTTGVGQRIARARRRRGLSQAVVAGLVGRSESWLSQVERGKRGIDSHAVLTRLAAVLRVDIDDLTGSFHNGPPRTYTLAAQIEQAMMGYDALDMSIACEGIRRRRDIEYLQVAAQTAYQDYQATRYEQTGRRLTGLIRDVEAASREAGYAATAVCRVRALVYDTTAALLSRVSEHALAWTAADRAMAAAENSGEPLLAAGGAWRLSYVLIGHRHPRKGLELAMTAAHAVERVMRSSSPAQLSIYGALYLAAATAAAALYDQAATRAFLARAHDTADQLSKDANLMGTAFGPANVAIHTMSTALRFGDARTAVEVGEALDSASLPPGLIGRRAQVYLDLARGYAMRRQDAAAVNILLAAEKLSPQLVRFDQSTGDVLTGLLRREHRPSTPELRPLAHRAGVI